MKTYFSGIITSLAVLMNPNSNKSPVKIPFCSCPDTLNILKPGRNLIPNENIVRKSLIPNENSCKTGLILTEIYFKSGHF